MASHRGGVTLPEECWEWLHRTALRDGTTRDDLLEGLVLLAMDREEDCPAVAVTAEADRG